MSNLSSKKRKHQTTFKLCELCQRPYTHWHARSKFCQECRDMLGADTNTMGNIVSRIKLIMVLGGKCVKCSCSDIRALEFDHIYGDGKEDRERIGYWHTDLELILYYLKHLEEAKQKIQLLCANCHRIKHSRLKLNKEQMRYLQRIVNSKS